MRYNAFLRRMRNDKPRFAPWRALLPWILLLLLAVLLSLWVGEPEDPAPSAPPPKPRPRAVVLPQPPSPEPEEEEIGCPEGCLEPRPGCEIKGNFRKEKIYHLPGQRWYDETRIDPGSGERWFCSESEAVANGWRKAKV